MNNRTIADYTVMRTMTIGSKEIALCENKIAAENLRYLCCFVEGNDVFERYTGGVASDDYAEIVEVYGKRISDAAGDAVREHEKMKLAIGELTQITALDCSPAAWEDSIENKIVVIDGDALCPEYRYTPYQLMLCKGGFGAQARARGRTCHCVSLFDQKAQNFTRSDILGTLEPDNLPDWAKEGLEKIKEEIND